MVIARNRALAIHHVTVQAIAGRLSVSLDLEVDGSLAFSRAHEIADGLEQAVRDELGLEVEVETHIEPLQTRGLSGRDAADERVAQFKASFRALRKSSAWCAMCTKSASAKRRTARSSIFTPMSIRS